MPDRSLLIKSILSLPEQERKKLLNSLSQEEAEELLYDWKVWAREKQLPPSGDWLTWMILTGRGWGKTRTAAEWVIDHARNGAKHIALIGQTVPDVRDTMVRIGPSSILKISHPRFMPEYTPSKRMLEWPNGTVATTYSGDKPDQVRGPSHDIVWIDELAKFQYPQDIWDNLMFGLRESEDMRILITTTPRPIKTIKDIKAMESTITVRGNTYENRDNLPKKYFEQVIAPYVGTRLGQQEIEGKILDDNPNALWNRKMIEDNRVNKCPDLVRIVVGVDPEASDTETSAETGIITAGIDDKGHGYILGDNTIKGSPDKWGNAVVTAYYRHKADRTVAEVNQGGDMVEYVIHTIDKDVAYKGVHAAKAKHVRAEPVSALYEQGRIHHVGNFIDLEDQMCEWVPGDISPDRLDACLVGETLVETIDGQKPIKDIKAGDMVLTRKGYKRVLKAGMTNKNAKILKLILSYGIIVMGTAEHLIYTIERGFIQLCNLKKSDTVLMVKTIEHTTRDLNILKDPDGNIFFLTKRYIDKYGRKLMVISQKASIYIIKMVIFLITKLQILNVLAKKNMPEDIRQHTKKKDKNGLRKLDHLHQSGTEAKRGRNGILNMGKILGRTENGMKKYVLNVARNILPCLIERQIGSAPEGVSPDVMKETKDITKRENALFAEQISQLKQVKNKQFVLGNVVGLEESGNSPVYNIEVEDVPEYFANGMLVHNCVWAITELILDPEGKPQLLWI